MNTFDQAIETAEARQAAPVTEAKAALAPARAELVRQARDFATAVAAANPIIVEAQEKQQAAGGGGHPAPGVEPPSPSTLWGWGAAGAAPLSAGDLRGEHPGDRPPFPP